MKNLNPKRHFAKTLIIAMVLLLSQLYMEAQRQISLKTLIDSAMNYYPIHQQTQLYQQAYELRNQQIKQDNLPQLELNGKATYQNEVVGINLQIPNYSIPEFSKDQYRISLDLQQNIFGQQQLTPPIHQRFAKTKSAKTNGGGAISTETQLGRVGICP